MRFPDLLLILVFLIAIAFKVLKDHHLLS